jgi:hypothetical protein
MHPTDRVPFRDGKVSESWFLSEDQATVDDSIG